MPVFFTGNSGENTFTTTTPFTASFDAGLDSSGFDGHGCIVVAIAHGTPSTDVITSVSYGGVALTRITTAADAAGEAGRVYLYFLGSGVPDGSNTLSIVHTGSATVKWASWSSHYGSTTDIEVVDSATQEGDAANPTLALDDLIHGSIVSVIYSGHDALASLVAEESQADNTTINDHDFGSFVARMDSWDNASVIDGLSGDSIDIGYTATSEDIAFAAIALIESKADFRTGVGLAVELAYTANVPILEAAALNYWIDITSYVRGIRFRRGRQHELNRIETGTMDVILSNNGGEFSSVDAEGTFVDWGLIEPMTPIRVWATYNTVKYPLWQGYVEKWPMSFPEKLDSVVTISCSDALKLFNTADFDIDTYAELIDARNPVAWYRFTDTGTADSSGNSHTLTLSGTPDADNAGVWQLDESMAFDGTDDYATVASEAALELLADMSIEAWVRPHDTSGGGQAIIACRGSGGDAPLYELYYVPDNDYFRIYPYTSAGAALDTDDVTSGANEWHHIVVTIDWTAGVSRTIKMYVNGNLVSSGTTAYLPGALTRAVEIGRRPTENDSFFDGDISELIVYDTVLTASQVSQHYAAQFETLSSQRTDVRIQTLLDDIGYPLQDLATGDSTMQAGDPEGDVMTEINKATDTEAGVFFMSADGYATFHNRHYRIVSQSVSNATFGPGASELPYHDIVPSYDDDNIRNVISITPEGGTTATVRDNDSVEDFGKRGYSLTTYPNDANEALDMAYWLEGLYAQPALRVDQIEIRLGYDADLWPVVLGAEIGDRFTIKKTLAGDDLEVDVHLEAISHSIDRDKTWIVTWQLSPATSQSFWVLDDTVLSVLDSTTRLAF